jgi:hypothetical protein
MRVTMNIVRLLFLVAAFAASGQTLAAEDGCNSYCTGTVRVFECTFVDDNYGGPSTVCTGSGWECYYGSCCGSGINVYPIYEAECDGLALANGGSRPPWFAMTSCDTSLEIGNCGGTPGQYLHAYGSYYCSFDDIDCS